MDENPPTNINAVADALEREVEACRIIGRFVLEFSQMEFTLRHRLAVSLNLPEKYFDIIVSQFDFAKLVTVTGAILTEQLPEMAQEVAKLVKRCHNLNTERRKLAHGTWTPDGKGFSARYVSGGSLRPEHALTTEKLRDLADEAQLVMQAVLTIGK